ncbi:MAG: carbohydrate ABC transporter permease [Clostridia bacterium]|nr:carbohydrate ABC transporter permease [Clostridia bacterium]
MRLGQRPAYQTILIYVAMIAVTLFFLLPLLWILRTSLITKAQAYQIPPNFNVQLTMENYVEVLTTNKFARYYLNSAVISLGATVLSVVFGAMSSYWLSRQPGNMTGAKLAILATQMIPPIVLVIPINTLIRSVGLNDSWMALILAYLTFNLPYVIWMLLGFYDNVPRELDEASAIDGCTTMQTFFKVVFPLIAPGMMATAVYSFLVSWNEFVFALVLTGNATRTIPVAIAALETQHGVKIAELCASTMLAILPIVILSSFIKKYLVNGLTFGSIK